MEWSSLEFLVGSRDSLGSLAGVCVCVLTFNLERRVCMCVCMGGTPGS